MSFRKLVLVALGFIFLGLGAVGIPLPVLPTTPLVLLAALCFSAGSERLHNWLRQSRVFGPYIENYRTGRGISLSQKIFTIVFLWAGLIVSVVFAGKIWLGIPLFIVGAGVTAHVVKIKTKQKTKNREG